MKYRHWNAVWLAMLMAHGCSSSPAPQVASNEHEESSSAGTTAAGASASSGMKETHQKMVQEISGLKSQIQELEGMLDQTHEDESDHHHDGSEGSPTEIEILKLLQKLNQRLMALEQRAGTSPSATENKEVVKAQVIEVARATLAEDPSVGQGYITGAQLIEANPTEEPNEWKVTIKFKKSRTDKKIFLATLYCLNDQQKVTCEDPAIKNVS